MLTILTHWRTYNIIIYIWSTGADSKRYLSKKTYFWFICYINTCSGRALMRQLHQGIYIYNIEPFCYSQNLYRFIVEIFRKINSYQAWYISTTFLRFKDYVYDCRAIIGVLNFVSAYDIFIASIILDVELPTNDFFEIHKD